MKMDSLINSLCQINSMEIQSHIHFTLFTPSILFFLFLHFKPLRHNTLNFIWFFFFCIFLLPLTPFIKHGNPLTIIYFTLNKVVVVITAYSKREIPNHHFRVECQCGIITSFLSSRHFAWPSSSPQIQRVCPRKTATHNPSSATHRVISRGLPQSGHWHILT